MASSINPSPKFGRPDFDGGTIPSERVPGRDRCSMSALLNQTWSRIERVAESGDGATHLAKPFGSAWVVDRTTLKAYCPPDHCYGRGTAWQTCTPLDDTADYLVGTRARCTILEQSFA